MGNECSAECGVRKGPATNKEPRIPRRQLLGKDPPVQLQTNAMALHREAQSWQARYRLSEDLGEGATATVLRAETEKAPKEESVLLLRCYSVHCEAPLGSTSVSGRPVAIKRFRKPATRSFQLELHALKRVGVHPNIVRLLESYSGSEDVLVLEYCDSLTLYDLIIKRHKTKIQFGRLLTSRLTQQLLLALEHVTKCGIIHQDVKPENLMLYDLSIEEERAHLKLGDFGWAATQDDLSKSTSPDGAGSLWYAPPELNPPVEGVLCKSGAVIGKSDMWSAGVVIYVLLVGHNPFHGASKLKDTQKVEEEVLRLVAKGAFDKKSRPWLALPKEAREFITQLLQPSPELRPMPSAARQHPYMSEQDQPRLPNLTGGISWTKRGGLQRLAWLAVARACAESDLHGDLVRFAFASAWDAADAGKDTSSSRGEKYIFHLAEKLSMKPAVWLKEGRWNEICQLAFRYLDVDGDGVLSTKDLCKHVKEDNASHVAANWVNLWGDKGGLSEEDFKDALLCEPDESSPPAPVGMIAR